MPRIFTAHLLTFMHKIQYDYSKKVNRENK